VGAAGGGVAWVLGRAVTSIAEAVREVGRALVNPGYSSSFETTTQAPPSTATSEQMFESGPEAPWERWPGVEPARNEGSVPKEATG